MKKPAIYIDGQEGTTGLRIRQMLAGHEDVEVLLIPPEHRRDRRARAEFLNRADLCVLCLPDDAATEALDLLENPQTKVIDTSTAHRVHPEWVYGLPEISPAHKEQIRRAQKVANCGCYPVAFILAVRPLISQGLLLPTAPLAINAVSGYSGGGRSMIAEYEGEGDHKPFCLYGLDGAHKHLPEIWKFSGCESRSFVLRYDRQHASAHGIFRHFLRQSRSRVRSLARILRGLSLCEGSLAPRRCTARRQIPRPNEIEPYQLRRAIGLGRPRAGVGFGRAARQPRQRSVGQCRAVPQFDAWLRRDRRAGLDARR
ncbi:MAG: N-acetyl-gamma-glutamyl-phosphate reductase [Candidatus Latescibacteria bacterium]|nr:N-acetyl-gamma-glutamyl-phosphate reductase [Candidatus Latescibacterota bacterium]